MSEKHRFKPWLKKSWCIPPKANAGFVCAMEDVLEVYHRRFEDNEVLVCLDETSKQLVQETRQPLPVRPGVAMAHDYEYRRNGVSNLFMLYAPLEALRQAQEAAGRGNAAAHQDRLGGGGAEAGGRGLPREGPHRAGDGQLEHPSPGVPV